MGGTMGLKSLNSASAGISFYGKDSTNYGTLTATGSGLTWSGTINATTFKGTLSGNASSASTLYNFITSNANNPLDASSINVNGLYYTPHNGTISLFGQDDGAIYAQAYSVNWVHEIYGDYRSGQIAIRGKNNNTWQAWRVVLDSDNYANYALSLTGGTMTGVLQLSNSGLKFADNAFGGGGDIAKMYLATKGGEATTMTFEVGNDGDDTINFITPSSTGLTHNSNIILDSLNYSNYITSSYISNLVSDTFEPRTIGNKFSTGGTFSCQGIYLPVECSGWEIRSL
jgi:hypothetical protein